MPRHFPASVNSLRICFLAPNAYPLLSGNEHFEMIGGAELQQVLVAKRLVERGHRVSMICLDFGQNEQVEIAGITVVRAFRSSAGVPVLRFLWPRLTTVWKCMARVDADIYYQRAASVWTGVMAAFCKFRKKKSVFAVAGNPDLATKTPRIRFARDRWIFAYGLKHVDQVLVQNDEQLRLCRVNVGRDAVLIRNIYPIPRSRATRTTGCILWVSTIRNLKRPELFLDLAESLPKLRFKMIGGPGRNEAALYESVRTRAGGIRNMEFLGFVPYSRIEEHFDDAALLVNTSESEGFPNAFLQAWARGVPSVSFVDAGARLDGEPIGLQIKSFDEMLTRVASLMSQEATRVELGESCRAYVVRYHSPEQVVALYEQLFTGLMQKVAIRDGHPGGDVEKDKTRGLRR